MFHIIEKLSRASLASDEPVTDLDVESRFDELKKTLPAVIEDILRVEGRQKTLTPQRVWIEDLTFDKATDKDLLKATKLQRGTWKIPVYADLVVRDKKTGAVISEEKKVRVADLPRPTPHQSMLINGTEYHPRNQLRLKPGVYVRERETGEVAAQFNFAKTRDTRMNFNVELDPDKGLFKMKIAQAQVGLYPLLSAMGVSDKQMTSAWGEEIVKANREKYGKDKMKHVYSLYQRLHRSAPPDDERAIAAVKDYFSAAKLDPEVTAYTLGKAYESVTPESLLVAGRKMLSVNRGRSPADDRDDLRFKQFMTYDEHVVERMRKAKASIQGKLRYRLDDKSSAKEAVLRRDLNRPIEQHLSGGTGLADVAEQLNPVGLMAEGQRVVLTGDGGISDPNVVTLSARSVHSSQAGFIDPVPTSQSEKAGIRLSLAMGAKKRGKDPVTQTVSLRSKKVEYLSPAQVQSSVVALPDQYKQKGDWLAPKSSRVVALKKNKMQMVEASEVTHVFGTPKGLFSIGTIMTPFVESGQGNRVLMAANNFEQSVPLVDPDVPLVQSRLAGNKSIEEVLGEQYSHRAPVAGTVASVSKKRIAVRPDGGGKQRVVSLYDNYPLNTGFIDSNPVVKVGDKVKKGDLLADTNHTRGGTLAMGANMRTAYMSMKGYGFEDAIVISGSAAKKLTSEHMHRERVDVDEQTVMSRKKYDARFPSAMNAKQRVKLDDDGVVRKGQVLTKGDTVAAVMRLEDLTPEDVQMGRIYRKLRQPWRDRSVKWDNDYDGVVVDVVKQPKGLQVFVKTKEPMKVGDKIVGRHGNKGVIGAIIPDGEMPQAEGGPIDVVINPLAVPSRLNPSQIHETAVGKAAAKLGKIIKVDNFENDVDNVTLTVAALKAAGMTTDKESVTDPSTGAHLGDVTIGIQHMLKLEHQADHKMSSRSWGSYDKNMQPLKGGHGGAASVGTGEQNALLAHGAKNFLREISTYKGDKNDEFWRAVQTGRPLPPPKVPFVFEKLVSYLKGAGINVEKQGNELQVVPMTDADVSALSSGEVKKPEFVRAKDLREIAGGMFDPDVTGGVAGKKWSHVQLTEPVLNPATRRAAAAVLDTVGGRKMTQAGLEAIATGDKSVEVGGKELTGGKAIQAMLAEVDVDAELDKSVRMAKGAKGAVLDRHNRRARYLRALQARKVAPQDSYVLTKLPVLPPVFRPVLPLPDGTLRPASVNLLMADVMHVNDGLKAIKSVDGIPGKVKRNSLRELQKTVDASFGFGDPLPSTRNRAGGGMNLRGLAGDIAGPQAKTGFFQDKVWKKRQDLSGRAVVVPNPELGLDEIGIPAAMAWETFKPFVVRDLVGQGMKALDAAKEVKDRSSKAEAALERAMSSRPVAYTRAPALHKFSFLGGWAKRVDGDVIQAMPLVHGGLNLDHDGDTMSIHVPVTPEGVQDVVEMMPSRHLVLPSTGRAMMVPSMEGVLGLYQLTEVTGSSNESYRTLEEARSAYKSGKIRPTVTVSIAGKRTTVGKAMVRDVLGKWYDDSRLDKKRIHSLAKKVSKESPGDYARIFTGLVRLANEESYLSGFTVGIDDLRVDRKQRDDFFTQATRRAGVDTGRMTRELQGKAGQLGSDLMSQLRDKTPGNAFLQMADSGAKGQTSQLRQILWSPVQVEGPDGSPVPVPIKKSYAEGLDLSEYWAASYGARKGVVDRSLQTSVPGFFAKQVINSAMSQVITDSDCGTFRGTSESVDDPDVLDRYLARPAGSVSRNTVITPNVVKQLKRAKIKMIEVRSPMRCEASSGICQFCYGFTHLGKLPQMGANIGVENAQYATEPTTQAQMRTFHTGGAAGTGPSLAAGFPSIQKLMTMPQMQYGKATLAQGAGRVDKVEAAPAGGFHVFVQQNRHYVPPASRVGVKVGDRVKRGDALSTGLVHPKEIAALTDIPTAQDSMVKQLHEQYGNLGTPLHKRVLHTIVRGLTNWVKVDDPGDHESWLPGDTVSYPQALKHNSKSKRPVVFQPAFKGISQAPLVQEDWLARMGATDIKRKLEDSVSEHVSSPIHGAHPLPAFVYGREFGLTNSKLY